MLSHVEPCTVFKLFKEDPEYVSQSSIPIERMLPFLLLALMYGMHVTSIVRFLTGSYTASYRDPDTMLQECKDALPPDLLVQLRHVTAGQLRQARAYSDHASVADNVPKVESTLNK